MRSEVARGDQGGVGLEGRAAAALGSGEQAPGVREVADGLDWGAAEDAEDLLILAPRQRATRCEGKWRGA
jgi:hypothetical protein